jgi:hypothetical protein
MEIWMQASTKSELTSTEIHEEIHKRYTQHLAEAMGNTKEFITSQILLCGFRDVDKSYEIKVDFDESS